MQEPAGLIGYDESLSELQLFLETLLAAFPVFGFEPGSPCKKGHNDHVNLYMATIHVFSLTRYKIHGIYPEDLICSSHYYR